MRAAERAASKTRIFPLGGSMFHFQCSMFHSCGCRLSGISCLFSDAATRENVFPANLKAVRDAEATQAETYTRTLTDGTWTKS
jgi:hypothetical protein